MAGNEKANEQLEGMTNTGPGFDGGHGQSDAEVPENNTTIQIPPTFPANPENAEPSISTGPATSSGTTGGYSVNQSTGTASGGKRVGTESTKK